MFHPNDMSLPIVSDKALDNIDSLNKRFLSPEVLVGI
jgi:hypothetical protein